jgi:hypothetical protein
MVKNVESDQIAKEILVLHIVFRYRKSISIIGIPVKAVLAELSCGLLALWQWPPWLVVLLSAVGGELLTRM